MDMYYLTYQPRIRNPRVTQLHSSVSRDCSQAILGCSQLKLRLGDLFSSSFIWEETSPAHQVGLITCEKECNIFYNLILAVTITFVIFYWSYKPTLAKHGRGLHNGVNTRRGGSLGSILEVGHSIHLLRRICGALIWLQQNIVSRKYYVAILKYHGF